MAHFLKSRRWNRPKPNSRKHITEVSYIHHLGCGCRLITYKNDTSNELEQHRKTCRKGFGHPQVSERYFGRDQVVETK